MEEMCSSIPLEFIDLDAETEAKISLYQLPLFFIGLHPPVIPILLHLSKLCARGRPNHKVGFFSPDDASHFCTIFGIQEIICVAVTVGSQVKGRTSNKALELHLLKFLGNPWWRK